MLPEERAMDACRELLLSPCCLCEKSEMGNWEGSYSTELGTLGKQKMTCPKEKPHLFFTQPGDLDAWRSQCAYSNQAGCNVSSERKCCSQAEAEECRSLAYWLATVCVFRQDSIQRWIEVTGCSI